MRETDVPLFVDLDGTLVAGDTLWISLRRLFRAHPAVALKSLLWLRHGKVRFKRMLALRIVPDPATLYFNRDVVIFLREEKGAGREVVLATAADEGIAHPIASHLSLFSAVLASDGTINLSGRKKLAAIQALAAGRPFDYIGDGAVDLPIFQAARIAMLVHPRERLLERASAIANVGRVFTPRGRRREVTLIR